MHNQDSFLRAAARRRARNVVVGKGECSADLNVPCIIARPIPREF